MSSKFQFSKREFRPYQKTRPWKNRKKACLAPSASLFLGLRGKVYGCCFNKTFPLGNYPDQSILEIWQGKGRKQINQALADRNFSFGCQACHQLISGGNYAGLPAHNYEDLPSKDLDFPAKLEFELDNTCNLECVMCRGEFSSAIRKNREGLPPIPSPYGEAFLEELKLFIPHLRQPIFWEESPSLSISIWRFGK